MQKRLNGKKFLKDIQTLMHEKKGEDRKLFTYF